MKVSKHRRGSNRRLIYGSRGEVVEWLKAPASKAGVPDEGTVSSNLTLSAIEKEPGISAGLFCLFGHWFEANRPAERSDRLVQLLRLGVVGRVFEMRERLTLFVVDVFEHGVA